MFLARVIGAVVATKKDELMLGHKLLLLRPLLVDESDPAKLRPGANTVVAVDRLGAGADEVVLFCQGSSARQASGMKSLPVDAVVVGIVDTVEVLDRRVYPENPAS
jgi:ethanolamine utilization protein EutN